MGIFYRRPLALFCAIFAAASLCGCILSCEDQLNIIFAGLSLAFILTFAFVIWKAHRAAILTIILCVLFATSALFLSFIKINLPQIAVQKYSNEPHNVTATVTQVYYSNDFSSAYKIKINDIDSHKTTQKALLELEYNANLEIGDIIFLNTPIENIKDHSDRSQSFFSEGVFYYTSSSPTVIAHEETFNIKLQRLNQKLCNLICKYLDGESGALVSALVLGNKELLSSQTIRDFRRAGISHVIAISGMHLSVLMLLFDFVLKKFNINKTVRGGTVVIVALFYLALTGFSLSTVRAFIMSAMAYLAFVSREDSDMLTNLLFSLFFILAASPHSIYDIGLWLSFLAVLGIFTAGYFIKIFSDAIYSKVKPVSKYAKRLSPKTARVLIAVLSSITTTIAANIFICVPAWLYFDEISLLSVLSNLIVSPFIFIVLFFAPVFIAISPIAVLAKTLGFIIQRLCRILLWIVSYITSFSNITVSLNYSFVQPIVILLAVFLFLCLVLKLKRKWLISIPPLIAAVAFALCLFINNKYYSQVLDFEYIGTSESEMLLIHDGREHIIIDVSSGAYAYTYDAYKRAIEKTATEISAVVITHYHNRHQSTMYKLFRLAVVKKLCLPYPQNINEYYNMCALIDIAIQTNVDVLLFDSNSKTNISQNVKMMLSDRQYLNRSTHPVFHFTLYTPTSNITFLSESAAEFIKNGDELRKSLDCSKAIILGAHGPKTKKEFSLDLSEKKTLIFADENIKNHFESMPNNKLTIYDNVSYISFRLPKQ